MLLPCFCVFIGIRCTTGIYEKVRANALIRFTSSHAAATHAGGEELFALPLTEYPDLEKTRKVGRLYASRSVALKRPTMNGSQL